MFKARHYRLTLYLKALAWLLGMLDCSTSFWMTFVHKLLKMICKDRIGILSIGRQRGAVKASRLKPSHHACGNFCNVNYVAMAVMQAQQVMIVKFLSMFGHVEHHAEAHSIGMQSKQSQEGMNASVQDAQVS